MAIYATEWTRRETEELIDLWEETPMLWNPNANDYHHRGRRQTEMRRIADTFRVPEEDVVRKLKALRTYYAREVAKELDPTRAGLSKDDTYRPKWPFFERLSFLREHITRRARPSGAEPSVQNSMVSVESGDSMMAPDDNDDEDGAEDAEDEPSPPMGLYYNNHHHANPSRPPAKRPRYERRLPHPDDTRPAAGSEHVQPAGDSAEDIFGRLIACGLRNIPCDRTRELTKIRIQNLIFEARFGEHVAGRHVNRHVPPHFPKDGRRHAAGHTPNNSDDTSNSRRRPRPPTDDEQPSVPNKLYPNVNQCDRPLFPDYVSLEADPVDEIVIKQELAD